MLQTLERRRKYIGIFLPDEHAPDVTNVLVTGDNVLHLKRVYLQKTMKVLFSSTMFKYSVTAPILIHSYLQI